MHAARTRGRCAIALLVPCWWHSGCGRAARGGARLRRSVTSLDRHGGRPRSSCAATPPPPATPHPRPRSSYDSPLRRRDARCGRVDGGLLHRWRICLYCGGRDAAGALRHAATTPRVGASRAGRLLSFSCGHLCDDCSVRSLSLAAVPLHSSYRRWPPAWQCVCRADVLPQLYGGCDGTRARSAGSVAGLPAACPLPIAVHHRDQGVVGCAHVPAAVPARCGDCRRGACAAGLSSRRDAAAAWTLWQCCACWVVSSCRAPVRCWPAAAMCGSVAARARAPAAPLPSGHTAWRVGRQASTRGCAAGRRVRWRLDDGAARAGGHPSSHTGWRLASWCDASGASLGLCLCAPSPHDAVATLRHRGVIVYQRAWCCGGRVCAIALLPGCTRARSGSSGLGGCGHGRRAALPASLPSGCGTCGDAMAGALGGWRTARGAREGRQCSAIWMGEREGGGRAVMRHRRPRLTATTSRAGEWRCPHHPADSTRAWGSAVGGGGTTGAATVAVQRRREVRGRGRGGPFFGGPL